MFLLLVVLYHTSTSHDQSVSHHKSEMLCLKGMVNKLTTVGGFITRSKHFVAYEPVILLFRDLAHLDLALYPILAAFYKHLQVRQFC